ncbi:MAG: translation initiation factor IF-2 N-terminal domain-containing protein, partial [Anoxybacillus ayderensis]|nr:translation initiation factor IF-2 N-terminal domain-containing protein [Anoxybacillus ayderensis]
MSKMRVYEYAKKHNVSSKDVIHKLKEMNIDVSNHMTMIEADVVEKLDRSFKKEQKQETKKEEKTAPVKKPVLEQFEEDEDEVIQTKVPIKKAVVKNREGKKHDLQIQQKEKKIFNNKKNKKQKPQQAPQQEVQKKKEKELPKKITFEGSLTVAELAKKLGKE